MYTRLLPKNDSRKNKYQSVIFSGTLDGSTGPVQKGDPNLISPKTLKNLNNSRPN